ncbi:MAG: 50S ribosomal L9 C-terminal domain-containing protein, partial [Candidatus Gracilibacteria bacterium]|nr:50S ribosomal L9 C-terminal domain-containing protein [Candidatus Gracilibacteria bacterium]
KEIQNKGKIDEQRRIANLENKHKIAETLNGKDLHFELQGKKDKIFGSITEIEVVSKIKKEFGIELEKGNIILPDGHHIKKVGKHDIKVNLGKDVYIKMFGQVSVKE